MFILTEMCLLSNDIYDYYNVSQGKTTIPNVDDAEEFTLTDVSCCTQPLRIDTVTSEYIIYVYYSNCVGYVSSKFYTHKKMN